MKVLVTGYNGQLGYDVIEELKRRGINDCLGTDRQQMDITDKNRVREFITSFNPDVIVHCAAYTAVDAAETDCENCYKVNVDGTKNIVEIAKELDCKMVYISTDYVFDGKKDLDETYKVDDIANPVSVYGKTKFLAEEEVRKLKKHFIVRITWAFGINGNNFVKTMLKLSETKDILNVVCDQIGSPTYTVDVARLIVDMIKTEKYGTYHGNNTGYISWAEFAEYILKDTNTKVNFVTTEKYYENNTKVIANRPFNSKLDHSELIENGFEELPNWQDAVDRYKKELQEKVYRR